MPGPQLEAVHDEVTIHVPASAANLGMWFDGAGAALERPLLAVHLSRLTSSSPDSHDLSYEGDPSTIKLPSDRRAGHAGYTALEAYFRQMGNPIGDYELYFEGITEGGYSSGGTGLSGAEAAGAIVAGAVMFNQYLPVPEAIARAAEGEAGQHKDNVAPSVAGGITFIGQDRHTGGAYIHQLAPPANLGLAVGASSHVKTGGTAAYREVLNKPINGSLMMGHSNRASVAALKLAGGEVDGFLELVVGDVFHEPRRADIQAYGGFEGFNLREMKQELLESHGVGMTVSGAGPSMLFWYNRNHHPRGLRHRVQEAIAEQFERFGVVMEVKENGINSVGAHQYARQQYPDWVADRAA